MGVTVGLYELIGKDPRRHCIVAVDISLTVQEPRITVYVTDAAADSATDPEQLTNVHGEIPVTAVTLVNRADLMAFLVNAFQRLEIRLTPRSLRDEAIVLDRPAKSPTE